MEARRHGRFLDGGRLTLMVRFLAISHKVGGFSTSRSDLELHESVEDPEAVDTCFIPLSNSLNPCQRASVQISINLTTYAALPGNGGDT